MKFIHNSKNFAPVLSAVVLTIASVLPAQAQQLLFDNGPVVTHVPGAQHTGPWELSAVQDASLGMTTRGFNCSDFIVEDDFTVSDGVWRIDSIVFFVFQDSATDNGSSITSLSFRIHDVQPTLNTETGIYGNLATNRMDYSDQEPVVETRFLESEIFSTPTHQHRVTGKIKRVVASTDGLLLPAGTYWINWQAQGSYLSPVMVPPISILGTSTTGDARTTEGAGAGYVATVDGGTGDAQGLPFHIYGQPLQGNFCIVNEGFDNGVLPTDWSTNVIAGVDDWQFGAGSVTNPGSVDGTNMAFFDDDDLGVGAPSSIVELESPVVNTSEFLQVDLSFDYNFRHLGNATFTVEAFDGATWQNLMTLDNNNVGQWNTGAGGPATHAHFDVTQYQNPTFQVRFRYDDGGGWTWYAGIDNFNLCASGNTVCEPDTVFGLEDMYCIDDTEDTIWAVPAGGSFSGRGVTDASLSASSFPFGSVAIPDNDLSGVVTSASVAGLPTQLGPEVNLDSICFTILHGAVGHLSVALVSPSGDTIWLMDRPGFPAELGFPAEGCDGENIDVCILPGFGPRIEDMPCGSGIPVYSGNWTAHSGDLFDYVAAGIDPNGTWELLLIDAAAGSSGLLADASIHFTEVTAPAVFDPATAGHGQHLIQYSSADNIFCSNDFSWEVRVTDIPPLTIADLDSFYCVNDAAVAIAGRPGPGTFSGPGITSAGGKASYVHSLISTPIAIPDGNLSGVDIKHTVAGVPGTALGTDVWLDSVCIRTTHTWVGDLEFILEAPDGRRIRLMDRPGVPASTFGCASNDLDICFVPGTGNEVEDVCNTVGIAIDGQFTVADGDDLGRLNNGSLNPNGNWRVRAVDHFGADPGVVQGVVLYFSSGIDAWFDPATAGVGVHKIAYTYSEWGCTESDTMEVEVLALPDPTIVSAGPFCLNDAPEILVPAVPGGVWSGLGFTNTTTGEYFARTAGVGSHPISYTVTDAEGCVHADTVNVDVFALPVANAGAEDSMCQDEKVVIGGIPAATGGDGSYTYLWSPNFNLSSTTVANPTANPDTTTLYNLLVTDGNGCQDNDLILVGVDPVPDPTIVPAGPFCLNDLPFDLNAASVNGVWSGPGIVDPVTGLFDPSTAGVGIHTINFLAINVHGCDSMGSTLVRVNGLPSVEIKAPLTFCEEAGVVTLIADVPGGVWSGNGIVDANLGSFDAGNIGQGQHQVTYTIQDLNGCYNSDDTMVTVNPTPDASIKPVPVYCLNEPVVTLKGVTAGGIWSGAGIQSGALGTFLPSAAGAGTHTITHTVTTVHGCTANATVAVTVKPAPVPVITPVAAKCVDAGPVQLQADTAGGVWSGNGVTNTTAGIFRPTVAGIGSHTITYTRTRANGCAGSSSITIVVTAKPNATITTVGPYCYNGSPVNLQAATAGGTWSGTGITSPLFGTFDPTLVTASSSITYTISAGGCTSSDTRSVKVTSPIVVGATVTNALCATSEDGGIRLNTSGGVPLYTYNWSNSATTSTISNVQKGDYDVTVTDAQGCEETATFTVGGPDAIVVTVDAITNSTSPQHPNGGADISVTGGTPPYKYIWSNGSAFQDLQNVRPDTFTVNVTDANGCTGTGTAVVGSDFTLAIDPTELEKAVLVYPNPSNGRFEVVVDYTSSASDITMVVTDLLGRPVYEWVGAMNGTVTRTVDLTGLAAGHYMMHIRFDGNQVVRKLTLANQ